MNNSSVFSLNPRECALEILHRLEKDEESPLPVLLRQGTASLQHRDAAFCTELVYGILRHSRKLDASLAPFLQRPSALSTRLKSLLRLGALEILYLDGIPARATVHESVGLARHRFGSRMGALTNAVLRALLRSVNEGTSSSSVPQKSLPQFEENVKKLAEDASLPLWLVEMWKVQYGEQKAKEFCNHATCIPLPCWRVNNAKPQAVEILRYWLERGYIRIDERLALPFTGGDGCIKCLPPPWKNGSVEHGYECVDNSPNSRGNTGVDNGEEERIDGFGFYLSPDLRKSSEEDRVLLEEQEKQGFLSRQGVSSQLLAKKVAARIADDPLLAHAPLWDACCGRGGKTAALLENGVQVAVAGDPSARRIADLEASLKRLELPFPEILCRPAQEMERDFPLILLDAPCSGTGTIARNPELRLRLSKEKLNNAIKLQEELLNSVWSHLLVGGLLFYATCALNTEENEGQTARFLKRHKDARLESQELLFPELPGADALFLAVFVKNEM